jgi:hypothetical protein
VAGGKAKVSVDDYLYRLQQDDEYVKYSATNPPTPANVAFTGWQSIPRGGQPGPVPLQRHQPGQPGHHPGALDRPGAGGAAHRPGQPAP